MESVLSTHVVAYRNHPERPLEEADCFLFGEIHDHHSCEESEILIWDEIKKQLTVDPQYHFVWLREGGDDKKVLKSEI